MDRTTLNLGYAAACGSASLLGGAFLFQLAGYHPCAMCIWQRYPYVVAIGLGLVLLAGGSGGRLLLLTGALATMTMAGLGVYHTGVERDWWEGPSSCTGGGADLSTMTGADLLSFDQAEPLVMCDEVA